MWPSRCWIHLRTLRRIDLIRFLIKFGRKFFHALMISRANWTRFSGFFSSNLQFHGIPNMLYRLLVGLLRSQFDQICRLSAILLTYYIEKIWQLEKWFQIRAFQLLDFAVLLLNVPCFKWYFKLIIKFLFMFLRHFRSNLNSFCWKISSSVFKFKECI